MLRNWDSTLPILQQIRLMDELYMVPAWSEQEWLRPPGDCYLLCAYLQNEVCIGFALYLLSPPEELAHLLKIVLHPDQRGQARAVAFWQDQCGELKRAGFKKVYLEVAESNGRARAFYQKLGFHVLHKVKGFYHNGTDALTMELVI